MNSFRASAVALVLLLSRPAIGAAAEPLLDAPLLFVKRHSYTGIHIYDTYYKWPPGGGGIYVLENPQAPREEWKIRPVIDETTPGSLGHGVYSHPEIFWDAKRLLFCFKGKPDGNTGIYEIRVDGTGLRRITDPGRPAPVTKVRTAGSTTLLRLTFLMVASSSFPRAKAGRCRATTRA